MKGILAFPENNIVSEIDLGTNQKEIYKRVRENISAETLDCRSVDEIDNQYYLIMYGDDNGYEKNLLPNEIASLIYSNGKNNQCIRGTVVFIIEHIVSGIIAPFNVKDFKTYLQKRNILNKYNYEL